MVENIHYLLLIIILSAGFCNLNNLLHSKLQHVIQNCRCDRIKESYISYMTEIGRYLLSLFITPRVRSILLAIFKVCALQLTNSFIVSPRKSNVVTLPIFVSQISKSGISGKSGICGDSLLVIMKNHEFS